MWPCGVVGRVEPCDCVSTSRSSGRVGLFGRVRSCGCVGPFGCVWPCGCVSFSESFGRMGPVGHLVFLLDAVTASYCTKGKQSIG